MRRLFADVFYAYLLMIESLTLADLIGAPEKLDALSGPQPTL